MHHFCAPISPLHGFRASLGESSPKEYGFREPPALLDQDAVWLSFLFLLSSLLGLRPSHDAVWPYVHAKFGGSQTEYEKESKVVGKQRRVLGFTWEMGYSQP